MHIDISREDYEFLKRLKHELNTQETDYQASPRFWVVAEHKKEYGIANGYQDGCEVYDPECCGSWDSVEEFKEYLIDEEIIKESELAGLESFEEILNALGESEFNLVGYRDKYDCIAPNTMFLTKKSCKRHIELNHYHYSKPHTYAMTAWRSPEVERLLRIISELGFTAELEECDNENS